MEYSKIRDDVDLKELERFGFEKHTKEEANVDYYKFTSILCVQILKDRSITYQLPIGSTIKKEYIILDNLIKDLIEAGLVEKMKKA